MPFTNSVTQSISGPGFSKSVAVSKTAGMAINIDEPIPSDAANLEVDLVLAASQVQSGYFVSTVDVLLETNNSTTPVDQIALKANVPYVFFTGGYSAFVFDDDVTSLFVTNQSSPATAGVLEMYILIDPTA